MDCPSKFSWQSINVYVYVYIKKKKKLKPRVSETQTLMVESLVGMRVGEENGSTK